MHCAVCALLSCVPGYYSSGCMAGSTRDAVCLQCMNRPAVGMFEWRKGCAYLCANGYHRVNNTMCMPCTEKQCSPGFKSSGCSDSSDAMCTPCPPVGHATWTTGCNFVCENGFVLNSTRGCVPCDAPGSDGTYVWTGSNCSFSCLYNSSGTNPSAPCLAVSPSEPMALVLVNTALSLNNTASVICSELDILLQALSKSMEQMNSCKCIRFVTTVTSFDGALCISNVCPQCRNMTMFTAQRRLFGSGVRLVTVSTSLSPAPVSLIQHTDSMQHSAFVQAELRLLLPSTLTLMGVVAVVSRVVVTPDAQLAAPSSVGLFCGVVAMFAVLCCVFVCAVVPKPGHCRVEDVKVSTAPVVSDGVSWMKGVRLLKRRSKSRGRGEV